MISTSGLAVVAAMIALKFVFQFGELVIERNFQETTLGWHVGSESTYAPLNSANISVVYNYNTAKFTLPRIYGGNFTSTDNVTSLNTNPSNPTRFNIKGDGFRSCVKVASHSVGDSNEEFDADFKYLSGSVPYIEYLDNRRRFSNPRFKFKIINSLESKLGNMRSLEFFSRKRMLFLASSPKFFGRSPQDKSKTGYHEASKRRYQPVVVVKPNAYPQDEGRYSIPVGAFIWGAILALATYFGKKWTDYRHRKIVERYAPRDRDGNPLPPLKPR